MCNSTLFRTKMGQLPPMRGTVAAGRIGRAPPVRYTAASFVTGMPLMHPTADKAPAAPPQTFQDLILRLQQFWAAEGCVVQQPYDMEMGAGRSEEHTSELQS